MKDIIKATPTLRLPRHWAFDAGVTIGICSLKVCPLGLRLASPVGEVNHSCLGRYKGSLLAHSSTHNSC